MTDRKTDPISDAALAELDRLRAEAHPGEWRRVGKEEYIYSSVGAVFRRPFKYLDGFKKWAQNSAWCCAIHNAYPALRERLRLLAAERDRWKHERQMTLIAFTHVRDGGDPDLIGHPAGSEFGEALRDMLSSRDARIKREGAAEVWDQIAAIGDQVSDAFIHVTAEYAREQAAKLREGK